MRHLIVLTGFFLSGFAALLYEIVWIRLSSLSLGSSTLAVSTMLAVLFLGLAVGSEVAGRAAARLREPLRLFAILEIMLGIYALATPALFRAADTFFGHLYAWLPPESVWLIPARALASGGVVLFPAVLMGATLPLLVRQYVRSDAGIAARSGMLYALNTLGAVAGCVTAGFFLIRTSGLTATLTVGAVIDFAIGLAVWWLVPRQHLELMPAQPRAAMRAGHGTIALLFVLIGFVALANEVLWTRHLSLLIPNNVYTYTITLAVVLAGIVAGTLLCALAASRLRWLQDHAGDAFAAVQIATGLVILATAMLPPSVWASFGDSWTLFAAALFPASVLSGAAFPLAMRLAVAHAPAAGAGAGRLIAANTLGGVAGSLVAGFALIPLFGLEAALKVTSALALGGGLIAWWRTGTHAGQATRLVGSAAAVLAWWLIPALSDTRIPQDFLAAPEKLVDFSEGRSATVAVVREKRHLNLEIDRWWQGSDQRGHQALSAHVPMLFHPRAREVLVIGIGAGQTPAAFLRHDLQRLDCVDIEPAVFAMVRRHFAADWMNDTRLELLDGDGRNHVRHSGRQYDLISVEVGQMFRPGIAGFYTADFYREARSRLHEGGLLAQFLPLPFFTPDEFRILLATFLSEFPVSVLWYNSSELLLIGFKREHADLDVSALYQLTSDPDIAPDLDYSYWGGPAERLSDPGVLLGGFIAARGLAALAGDAVIYRDDRPFLEYYLLGPDETRAGDLPIAALLKEAADPFETMVSGGLPPELTEKATRIRVANLNDIPAAAWLRRANTALLRGQLAEAQQQLLSAVQTQPGNVQANRLMAGTLIKLDRMQDAEPYLRAALAVDPADTESLVGLGVVLLQTDRVPEALEVLKRATVADPGNAEAHNNLGTAHARQGDPWSARHHFEIALRLQPGHPAAQRNLEQLTGLRR